MSPSESAVIETSVESSPELLAHDRPVFDADAESDKDKNRRIAAELFKDDEKDDAPIKPEKDLQAPPAQRRRQAKAEIPAVGETPADKERVRGADGKFVAQTESIAAEQPPPEVVAEPPAPVEPPIPLEWLAYGQPVNIPGALYKPGHGVFVPEAEVPNVRQAWARAQRYPEIVAQNEQLRNRETQLYSKKEAAADAVLAIFGPKVNSPQALQAFMQEVQQSPEMAFERLSLAIQRKEMELQQNVIAPDPQSNEPDAGEITESLTDEFERFMRIDPELSGKFTPKEQRDLLAKVFENGAIFLTRVDRDYDIHGAPVVSADQQVEVRKGEVLVNRARLLAELRLVAQGKQGTRTGSARQEGGAESAPPARRPAPPSAAGRSRASAPASSQTARTRSSDTIPNHSLAAAADWLFAD